MRVVESGFCTALCEYQGEIRQIDTLLVGNVNPGDWILVFIDAAREIIDEKTALQIQDALKALDMAMAGNTNIDHLFADLINPATEPPAEPPNPNALEDAGKD